MRKVDIKAERDYENLKVRDTHIRQSQNKFYWATELITESHEKEILAKIKGKKVLEIGCSIGETAKIYAPLCSSFTGVDVADEAINEAKNKAIKNARFQCCDAHKLPFSDNSFDAVIVNGVLHHLELETSLSEIGRVLAHGGMLLFREPLGTNPLFQLYRFMTPAARTRDERPFTFSDLALMRKSYELKDVHWYGFTNILSAFIKHPSLRASLTRFDALLAKTKLRYFYWQICGVAIYRGEK